MERAVFGMERPGRVALTISVRDGGQWVKVRADATIRRRTGGLPEGMMNVLSTGQDETGAEWSLYVPGRSRRRKCPVRSVASSSVCPGRDMSVTYRAVFGISKVPLRREPVTTMSCWSGACSSDELHAVCVASKSPTR